MIHFRQSFSTHHRLTSDQLTPIRIAMNITRRCNLHCAYCENSRSQNTDELNFDGVLNLLSFAKADDISVFIGGGEPFLYSRIWDVFGACIKRKQKVSVVTNGTCLSRLTDEQQRMLNDAIDTMSISMDSPSPNEQDRLKGVPGSWDQTFAYVVDKKHKHRIGINTVLSLDLKNVIPMIRFGARLGLPINFKPMIFESCFPDSPKLERKNAVRSKMPSFADLEKDLNSASRYAVKQNVITNLSLILFYLKKYYESVRSGNIFYDRVFNHFTCFIPFTNLTVNEKGEIMPCMFLKGRETIYGKGIRSAWLSSALEYRRRLKQGDRFPVCRSCSPYFAENMRYNMLAHPFRNLKHLPRFVDYYLHRICQHEGRE
jgi:MoaA/NifB/PqqE/SkfB family radical SAM enzyme